MILEISRFESLHPALKSGVARECIHLASGRLKDITVSYTHLLHTLEHVRADKILRLTMLLHDVATPVCITTDEEGQNHLKKHPVVGADMTRKILRSLKFDNRTTDCCCKLVKEHDDRPAITERNVRRRCV